MMPGRFVSLIVSVVAALLLVSGRAFPALADSWPKGPPNDPGYEPAEQNPVEYSPSQEQTYLYSFLPKGAPLATDPEGSSGIWVDRAWRDFTIGRADTLIAYIEGGINWRAPDIAELADKVFINTGELPKKVRVHLRDWNHDGWISAPDVATATTKAKLAPVKDLNHNGIVDAEDVIARFSNGKDDDHNGYVDDISGWDFYDHQNDPGTVDSAYMHANGQMEQAAAITNNGIGTAGICPMCMIVPIKAGAEALDRDPDLAQAWLYATDIGADVIVSVTADLGYSTFMRQAVEYAVHHGVVAVQSSNDFDSTDHQGGMWWPHVLPGNGMVEDENVQELSHATTTYRARSGETSWGTHNMFTVATQGGSTSESTPTVGGVAAMLLSYGKTAAAKGLIRRPLTNFEAIQVLRSTASDVADPSLPWPGKPGWDLQYGYGRPNLWKAMRAVSRGDIPPAPTIESPGWFTYYDPTVTHTVNVFGHVEARRSSSYRWELRMGLGPEPTDSEFKVIGHGVGHAPRDGVLGVIDLRSIPKSFATAPFAISKDKELSTTEQYTVTLRLRVTDAQGRMGEERRTIFVHHDPTALPGFPLHVGPEVGQPALVDLNGDGRMDIVFGDVDGRVHAIDPKTRRELPGWPVTTDPIHVVKSHAGVHPGHEPLIDDVSVGDLDHNGHQWVVGTSEMGRVYVWDSHGHRRPGWPKLLDTNVHQPPVPRPNLPYTRLPVVGAFSPPVLSDLKGDGRLEIIQAGWDGFLHVWKPNGRTFPGWPVEVKLPASFQPEPGHFFINDHKLDDPAIVADLDGDGKPELVIRSQWTEVTGPDITPLPVATVSAYHADGTPVAGWPVGLQGIAEYYGSAQEFLTEGTSAPVAANIDGVPGDEVAVAPVFSPTYVISGTGTVRGIYGPEPDYTLGLAAGYDPATVLDRALPADIPVSFTTTGAFGRFGSLGRLAYSEPGSGGASIILALLDTGSGVQLKNYLRAYDAQLGVNLPGFPAFQQGLNFIGMPDFADVTGDGKAEILDGADSSAMAAYTDLGAQAPGFPKFTTGWTVAAPSVGDLDGDGKVEVVTGTREGYLFAWRTPGLASANTQWWHTLHDEWNSGNYGTDARPPGAIGAIRWDRTAGILRFVAPGDDWFVGRVARYRVLIGSRWTSVRATVAAGKIQRLAFRPGAHLRAIQAVDDAGNLGPLARLR